MNNILVLFIVSYLVSTSDQTDKISRLKREINENDWIWGTTEGSAGIMPNIMNRSNETNSVKPTTQTPPKIVISSDPTKQKIFDDCVANIKPFVLPDFRKPERSYSTVRCMETVWDAQSGITKQHEIIRCNKAAEGNRLYVGGRDTHRGEFPHMAAIGWKTWLNTYSFKCGASLISEKFVMTAAHCSEASQSDTELADSIPKIVRIGIKNLEPLYEGFPGVILPNEEGRKNTSFMEKPVAIFTFDIGSTDVEIKRIIVHPDYKAPEKYNDIALIELSKSVKFTHTLFPACIWTEPTLNTLGDVFVGTGWGVVREGDTKISPELQAADLDLIDSQKCDEMLSNHCSRNWCGLSESQLCAGKLEGGVDSCQGDSGGPLQKKLPNSPRPYHVHYVVGVTSFGVGCGHKNLPGVFTRVSSFNDWIEDIVWPQNTRQYKPYNI